MHLLQAQNSRKVPILYNKDLGTVFEVKTQAQFLRKWTARIPRQQADFSGTFFESVQKHLMLSVQYGLAAVLEQFSRAEFCHSCTEIEDWDFL